LRQYIAAHYTKSEYMVPMRDGVKLFVEFLLKTVPHHNGRVGISGTSYPGFYSTMAALSGHPALKAVSPQAPVTEWFIGDDFRHNGALYLAHAFGFFSSFGRPKTGENQAPGPHFEFGTAPFDLALEEFGVGVPERAHAQEEVVAVRLHVSRTNPSAVIGQKAEFHKEEFIERWGQRLTLIAFSYGVILALIYLYEATERGFRLGR